VLEQLPHQQHPHEPVDAEDERQRDERRLELGVAELRRDAGEEQDEGEQEAATTYFVHMLAACCEAAS
jgi:hypothetical protein